MKQKVISSIYSISMITLTQDTIAMAKNAICKYCFLKISPE